MYKVVYKNLYLQLGCFVWPLICGWIVVRYVALSPNDKTGFRARELKSIHVDAIGCFVKFVIHKNHSNKYNAFNQVIFSTLLLYYTLFMLL